MKPLKVGVSLTLDAPLVEKLKILAERDDRPLSSYINLVLRSHVEQLEQAEQAKNPGSDAAG